MFLSFVAGWMQNGHLYRAFCFISFLCKGLCLQCFYKGWLLLTAVRQSTHCRPKWFLVPSCFRNLYIEEVSKKSRLYRKIINHLNILCIFFLGISTCSWKLGSFWKPGLLSSLSLLYPLSSLPPLSPSFNLSLLPSDLGWTVWSLTES